MRVPKLRIGSLFSGIGGLELGLERAGVGRVAYQIEIDPFCRLVLAKHWPGAQRYRDVTDTEASSLPVADVTGLYSVHVYNRGLAGMVES